MSKYLLHCNGKGRVVEIDNSVTSADDWGRIEMDFATESHGGRKNKDELYAGAESLYRDQVTANGVPYTWELCGPEGAWYQLLCFGGETKEVIDEAKRFIKCSFDAVRIDVLKLELI